MFSTTRIAYHTNNNGFQRLRQLGVAFYDISEVTVDWFYLFSNYYSREYVMYLSLNSIDLSVASCLRRDNVFVCCETECCGVKVEMSNLREYFFSKNIAYNGSEFIDQTLRSGFGDYLRSLFYNYILKTSYKRYILHGCESESVLKFNSLKGLSKEIKYYGLPEYTSEDCKLVNISFMNYKMMETRIRELSNNVLKLDDVRMINRDKFTSCKSLKDVCDVCDELQLGFSVFDKSYASIKFNNCDVAIIMCNLVKNDFFKLKGFKAIIQISTSEINDEKYIKLNIDDELCVYEVVNYSMIISFDDIYGFRNRIQRKYIGHNNLFDVARRYDRFDEINIAILCASNIKNLKRWTKNKGMPIKNVIGVVPDFYAWSRIVPTENLQLNSNTIVSISYKDSRPVLIEKYSNISYEDILFDSFEMYRIGYDYESVLTFEVVVDTARYNCDSLCHINDVRKMNYAVFTDRSLMNVQSGLSSPTSNIKSLTRYLKEIFGTTDSELHINRFKYMFSDDQTLQYHQPWMWSLAYKFINGQFTPVDYSGHLANFLLSALLGPKNLRMYQRIIKNNIEGYKNINMIAYGIDKSDFLTKTQYANIESRTPDTLIEDLWHTREEFIVAIRHFKILSRLLLQSTRFIEVPAEFINFFETVQFDSDRNQSLTVKHDIIKSKEHQIIIIEAKTNGLT